MLERPNQATPYWNSSNDRRINNDSLSSHRAASSAFSCHPEND